ncbi:MAG TPA: lytic transglycosylase domain-containing protein [Verrucomicrobiae bacterium]|nr:lytic transglycosylase domain-containing protein [Verrucomicrobiae bacterium]
MIAIIEMKRLIKLLSVALAVIFLLIAAFQLPLVQKLRYPMPYKSLIYENADKYGVDPFLITAVIREESKFMPKSLSTAGARGLMQLMPETAKWAAELNGLQSFTPEDLYQPETNIMLGSWYIANLSKQFNNNTVLVLTAYNAGRGRVKDWLEQGEMTPQGRSEEIPITETREYVKRVLNSYAKYKKLYGD